MEDTHSYKQTPNKKATYPDQAQSTTHSPGPVYHKKFIKPASMLTLYNLQKN